MTRDQAQHLGLLGELCDSAAITLATQALEHPAITAVPSLAPGLAAIALVRALVEVAERIGATDEAVLEAVEEALNGHSTGGLLPLFPVQ
jgi:hypothetical protein